MSQLSPTSSSLSSSSLFVGRHRWRFVRSFVRSLTTEDCRRLVLRSFVVVFCNNNDDDDDDDDNDDDDDDDDDNDNGDGGEDEDEDEEDDEEEEEREDTPIELCTRLFCGEFIAFRLCLSRVRALAVSRQTGEAQDG